MTTPQAAKHKVNDRRAVRCTFASPECMAILKCLATGDFHPIDASDGAHMHQPKRGEHYVIMFALSSKGGFWRITESHGHDEAAATASAANAPRKFACNAEQPVTKGQQ